MRTDLQAKLAFCTVMTAMVILIVAFLVAVFVFRAAEKPGEIIVAILGAITGVLGTLAGYVAGESGKRKAEDKADVAQGQLAQAERRLTAVVDSSEKGILEQAKRAFPELFAAEQGEDRDA